MIPESSFMLSSKKANNLILSLLFFILSCSEQQEISSYVIPSEYDGPVVVWKIPPNWGENEELSGPLAGSFHIKTELGPVGRIGVMPFREAVSSLEVANMFGSEMGYDPFDENSLSLLSEEKKLGKRTFEWIRLVDKSTSESSRTALLALLRQKSETWLFPFIADSKLVDTEMANFCSFLETIVFRAGKTSIRARSIGLQNPTNQTVNSPTWETPKHWMPGKQSSMRIASYEIKGDDGSTLDFSITTFPGDVGGLLANVNRWLGQIGLDSVDEIGLEKYVKSIEIDGKPGKLLVAENDRKALFAALLFGEKDSWFFKITGDSALAKIEKKNFIGLLDTVCFHDH